MKIGIIGLGSVGSAIATSVYNTGLAREIILLDRDNARSIATAQDLGHAAIFGFDIKITPASGYRDFKGCDIVIIAAGANQKPGQSRNDLLNANASVMRDVIPNLMKNVDAKKVILVIVTNPLDVMVSLACKLSKLPESRVIGTGTMLDSARLRSVLSKQLEISPTSINAYVLGEHGDSSVINWSSITVGNIALDDFCKQTKRTLPAATRKIIDYRVKNAAAEIIKGRGATWDGIAAAAADLIRAIVNNEHRILTVSISERGAAMSWPRIVGANGVSDTLQPKTSLVELAGLKKSMAIIQSNIALLK